MNEIPFTVKDVASREECQIKSNWILKARDNCLKVNCLKSKYLEIERSKVNAWSERCVDFI